MERWSIAEKYVCFTFLAAMGCLGALAKYLNELVQNRRKFSVPMLALNTSLGGILGIMFGMPAHAITEDHYLIMFVAGCAGAIGWPMVDMLTLFIKNRLRKYTK